MKAALVFLAVIASTLSAKASSLEENITCRTSDKSLKIEISTVNRPDFDLGKYDSADEANDDGVNTVVTKNGKVLNARLITYTSIDGKTTPTTETGSDGKPCISGSKVSGIQVAAKLAVGRAEKLFVLICTDDIAAPHGGDCQ